MLQQIAEQKAELQSLSIDLEELSIEKDKVEHEALGYRE